jgi:ankyrin repeat protein
MQHTAHRENVADRPELDDATIEFATQVFDLARSGDTSTLEQLLEHGLAPNLRNAKGDSLLMLASYHGHLDTVRVLLQYKADPDLRNQNGQTPIAGAAFKGNLPMIELLLAHGADIEGASPDGRTALMIAARS